MLSDAGTVVVDRYLLKERIGVGGAAEVYAADDLLLHRQVAVKLFRSDTELSDERRVLAEMRTLAGLNHAGIVTVFDAGLADGDSPFTHPFIVMELVRGRSLKARLTSGPLPEHDVALLATSIASTLVYLHEQGLVHRDIKPANVLLAEPQPGNEFTAKLSDFGVALVSGATRVTSVGLTVGSANYLAPEQLGGGDLGPPLDVYSFGLVLLESLTARQAFPGQGLEAAMARLQGPPVVPDEVPEHWARLIEHMTQTDPAARPTAGEVLETVKSFTAPGSAAVPSFAGPADGASTTLLTEVGSAPSTTRVLPTPRPTPAFVRAARSSVRTSALEARDRIEAFVRTWRPLVFIGAGLVCLVVVLLLTTRHSPGRGPAAPKVTYSPVAGPLASPIRQLEQVIG